MKSEICNLFVILYKFCIIFHLHKYVTLTSLAVSILMALSWLYVEKGDRDASG